MWPFEVHAEGKTYLHRDSWNAFCKQKESEYQHNWLHRRLFMMIRDPRGKLTDVPLPKQDDGVFGLFGYRTPSHQINFVSEDWSVIFEPYPAFAYDDQNLNPSFHLYVEDKHPKPTYGDPVTFLCTGPSLTNINSTIFALFRNQYWYVDHIKDYGIGTVRPPLEEMQVLGTKKRLFRTIDDL